VLALANGTGTGRKDKMNDITTPATKWVQKYLGNQSQGVCPACRQTLPADAAFRVYVRYGDGDDLIAYVPTYGTALAVLIGWHDDEVGQSFWDCFPTDSWKSLSPVQVLLLAQDPQVFARSIDADGGEQSKAGAEIFEAIESNLMDTPLIGAVWIDSLREPVMPSDYR
jgi:hypothetical protein